MFYYVCMTINTYIIYRLFVTMFVRVPDNPFISIAEEEKNLKAINADPQYRFLCPVSGRLTINTDMKSFSKVPDLYLPQVKLLFAEIEKHRGFAGKNLVAWLIAAIFYIGIVIWHLCNIFILENMPMTYIQICWG